MNCPKCKTKLLDNCCPKCGYLSNGNQIKDYESKDKFIYQRLFNKKFDKMYRNDNSLVPFFLGGIYVSFRGYPIIGIIISLLELIIFKILFYLIFEAKILFIVFFILGILLVIGERLFLGAVENSLCLYLDDLKVNYIIKKKKNYKEILMRHHSYNFIYLVINLLCYLYIMEVLW